jgi:hypothetical protein
MRHVRLLAAALLLSCGAATLSRGQSDGVLIQAGDNPTAAVPPEDPRSPVHPRKFGFPGGVGPTRGWYIWRKFDAERWMAEVSHEGTGESFTVRVLPWATTYRYLAYGAHPAELLPGERVNLFFAPDDKQKRGFLVHFQDELCQMKGHGHVWEVIAAKEGSADFTARVLAGDKPLDDRTVSFRLEQAGRHWRGGKQVELASVRAGERLYLTWAEREGVRRVFLTADDASLDAIKKAEEKAVNARLAADGLGAHVEAVDGDVARLLIFPAFWAQAGQWKDGQQVLLRATTPALRPTGESIAARLLTHKNLGTYGSGATEISVRLARPDDAAKVRAWLGGKLIHVGSQ